MLESAEEVEAIRVFVRVVIRNEVRRLFVGGLGQIGGQVVASCKVVICSGYEVSIAGGLKDACSACLRCLKRSANLSALVADGVRECCRFEYVLRCLLDNVEGC